jgi:hypothetical protein
MLKPSEAGSIVCTITVANVRTKKQPQTMLDSYNFGAGLDYKNITVKRYCSVKGHDLKNETATN